MADIQHNFSVPEGFRVIPGFNGMYYINENGDVWSTYKHRLMDQHPIQKTGYLGVLLLDENGKKYLRRIHQLVVITWIGSAPGTIGAKRGQYVINHKDCNKHNNHISNLEWITAEDNIRHAWENGRHAVGEDSSNVIFTSQQVRQMRLRMLNGEGALKIAKEFGVSRGSVQKIKEYRNWKQQDLDIKDRLLALIRSR